MDKAEDEIAVFFISCAENLCIKCEDKNNKSLKTNY